MAILNYYVTNDECLSLSSDINVVEMFLFIFELKMLHKAVQKFFYIFHFVTFKTNNINVYLKVNMLMDYNKRHSL